MIGLCGSHRVGKTTLAKEYAKGASIPFVETNVGDIFKTMGFDPKMDYGFKIRMIIQNKILDVSEKLWGKYEGEFITDRTPIDMLAYTMADVQRENLDKDDESIFMEYMDRCLNSASRHFSLLVVVQPGIPLIEAEGKAPNNIAYIEHINSLIIGSVTDQRIICGRFILNRKSTGLTERCELVDKAMNRMFESHAKEASIGNYSLH